MEQLFEASIVAITLLLFVIWLLKQLLDTRRSELESVRREMQQVHEELARDHEQLSALTDITSDALILLDKNAQVVFLNDAAKTLFSVREGVGLRIDELSWARELEPLVDQVMQHGEPIGNILAHGERSFAARLRPLQSGPIPGVLIGLHEITELQRLGRARREFVANISHELRNPVATLQLMADTFTQETLRDEEFALELLGKARAQIDLLRQLTDELMDLAVIESGQAPIKLVETSAVELVNEAIEPLRPQAERRDIALVVSVPEELRALADPQGIRKVLGNLVHNAIKFSNPGGRVEILARRCDDDVEFAVADTGCGIAAKDLPRIFERFYRADRARGRGQGERGSTGLGLAIAKHMVEAHGGKIRVESVEGQGATFYFTLPAAG